ncbi:DUF3422 family protein [Rheinheimera sp.]|uniref:DUF3422 family protein n=1 Tax=Rheinheimera sp. TaxID=1869214 RepID=UPI003AF47937
MSLTHLRQHPLRDALEQELQQRFFPPLQSPALLCQFVLTLSASSRAQELQLMKQLAAQLGQQLLDHEQDANLHWGEVMLRWERHNEFSTLTFIRAGLTSNLFAEPMSLVPDPDWLAQLPGQVFRVVVMAVVSPADLSGRDPTSLFASQHLISSELASGQARLWTDFRKHSEGAGRILLLDRGLSPGALAATVQQVFDLGNYRKLALLGWPYCKQALYQLAQQEQQLADITRRIEQKSDDETRLLDELMQLAAQSGHQQADNASRLQASHAYYQLTLDRLKSLNESPVEGLMSLQHFTERRLTPAWRTARSVLTRQQQLSERLGRATELLRTQITIRLTRQNQHLLSSMEQRAGLQLKLQAAVERLSVVAISYYALQLLDKAQQSLKHWWPAWPADWVQAFSIPLVIGLVFWYFWRLKRQLHHAE